MYEQRKKKQLMFYGKSYQTVQNIILLQKGHLDNAYGQPNVCRYGGDFLCGRVTTKSEKSANDNQERAAI